MQFHVLASGSSGNACVLEAAGFGVLLDFGLPIRSLTQRLRESSLTWNHIHAVLLTHTHSDHWQPAALAHVAKLGVPVYCHPEHGETLARESRAYQALSQAGLVRFYEPGERFSLHPECHCLPIALQHDSIQTTGFRFEGASTIFGASWAFGYAADLGCWSAELAKLFADVDLLALEFNHDVSMQLRSGRHPLLIRRVLSDRGHLSNDQAAKLFDAILQQSEPGRLQALIQLHLSRDCNRPDLARLAAQKVLDRFGSAAGIHTTEQEVVGPSIRLGRGKPATVRRQQRQGPKQSAFAQPLLGYEIEENADG